MLNSVRIKSIPQPKRTTKQCDNNNEQLPQHKKVNSRVRRFTGINKKYRTKVYFNSIFDTNQVQIKKI